MSASVEAEVGVDRTRATFRLEQLYAAHAPRAGRLAYLLTADPQLAQDLAQEAFARLIIRYRLLRNDAVIDAYLRRTVINLAKKHWRRLGRERAYVRREGPIMVRRRIEEPDLSERDVLWRVLNGLPYRQSGPGPSVLRGPLRASDGRHARLCRWNGEVPGRQGTQQHARGDAR